MDNLSLLLAAPAIVALVQVCKDFGLKGVPLRVLPLAIPVGVLLVQHFLGGSALPDLIAQGVLIGLAAMGVYDAAKTAGVTNTPPVIPDEPEV